MAVEKKYKNKKKNNNNSKNKKTSTSKKKKKYNNQNINNKKKNNSKKGTNTNKKNNSQNRNKKSNNNKKYNNNLNDKKIVDNSVKKDNIVEEKIETNNDDVLLDKDIDNNVLDNTKICEDNILEKVLEDTDDTSLELNKDTILNDNENSDNSEKEFLVKYKKDYSGIFIVLILVIVSSLIVIFFPKIELVGDREIIISYKDSYVELGYSASSYNRDISNDIYIDSNLVDGVVGEYEINYYLDMAGSKLKKTRYVKVVDQDKPNILIDSDSILVCPNNKNLPDIDYSANDEYDGDITSLVLREDRDDEIILKVSDSSNNFISRVIKVERKDSEKPSIKLKGSSYMFIEYGNKYIEPGYEVSDNCSEIDDSDVMVRGIVGRNVGTYTITYEVSDEVGNKNSVTRQVVVGNKVVDNGVVKNGMIYLTFDDGPNYGTTDKILDILKSEGVKATFFVTNRGPDNLIKRMHDEGHTVALHTANHDYSYIYSSVDNYFNDLYRVRDRVKRITGVDSKIIRFPGGSSNTISKNYKKGIMTELTSLVVNQGYRYFDWNVDAMDASSARSGDDVYYNVISNLSGNRANVVLMHDTKSITVNGLRDIIKYGKNRGYNFSNIDMNTYMVRHSVNN